MRGDDDNDDDTYNYWDDHLVRNYGHVARPPDRMAIAGLLKRYFAVAFTGDGGTACSMLSVKLAGRGDLVAAIPRDYVSPAIAALPGKPCRRFMSMLFKQAHEQLAVADVDTLELTTVRVQGNHGLALLGFRTAPERYIAVKREHGTWKIDGLLDSEII